MTTKQRGQYRWELQKGETRGYTYQIISPSGQVLCYGARTGNKKDVRAHLEKICKRLDSTAAPQPLSIVRKNKAFPQSET